MVRQQNLDELCQNTKVDTLRLTLKKTGEYSFNYQPCFADRKNGKWQWTDDMVGAYIEFDMNINNYAYFYFDDTDTLRLIKDGRTYLTLVKSRSDK